MPDCTQCVRITTSKGLKFTVRRLWTLDRSGNTLWHISVLKEDVSSSLPVNMHSKVITHLIILLLRERREIQKE